MRTRTMLVFIFASVLCAVPAFPADDVEPDPMLEPTKNGLRLTPAMARAFASQWLSEHVDPEITLTADQQVQLSESVAKRLMEGARKYQGQTQHLLEYTIENFSNRRQPVNPETGQKLAERSAPMIPAFREFLDGVGQDARSVLKPEDMTRFEQRLRQEHANVNNFETKMQRWSQGQINEGEQPFTELEATDTPVPGGKKPPSPAVRRAIRRATWSLSNLGPAQWETLLVSIKRLFKFTEEQSAKADEILTKYRADAELIMTPEWKKSLQDNRLKYNLRAALPEKSLAPWLFHLDRQFNETLAPLSDLGQKFRTEILNLVTDEQRAVAAKELEQLTAAHGMKLEEADKTMLGLNPHH
jgi:hypothetical protein